MTTIAKSSANPLRPARQQGATVIRAALVGVLKDWVARRRSRLALMNLSEHHLRDIGLDRLARDGEAAKPFWK